MTIAEQTLQLKKDFDDVYAAGIEAGKASGGDYDSAFAAGVKSEYDRFWDSYQDNGKRTDYQNAFSGPGWNNETFKPKYNINSTYSYMMFRFSKISGDLVELLKNLNVTITMGKNTNLNYAFQGCNFTRIGDCTSSATGWDQTFASTSTIEIIDSVASTTGTFTKLTNTFQNCTSLREVRFNSIIACTFSMQWCKSLSAESLKNIIEHLSDTLSGFTVTLPSTAEATYNAKYGEGAWLEFAGDGSEEHPGIRPNWSIAYM